MCKVGESEMSPKVVCVCGKPCSGKTTLAKRLAAELPALLLSCDELTDFLFDNDLGERHDAMLVRVKEYLLQKAADAVGAGCTAVLDWGLWDRADRQSIRDFFSARGIPTEWIYLDVPEEEWQRRVAARNAAVARGESRDFYLDEGLLRKIEARFEPRKKTSGRRCALSARDRKGTVPARLREPV